MKKNNYPNFLVPTKIAKELKKIGFDKPCYYKYDSDGVFFTDYVKATERGEFLADIYINLNEGLGDIPTWEDVLEWFREKGYECSLMFDTQIRYVSNLNDKCYIEKVYHLTIRKYDNFVGKYVEVRERERDTAKLVSIGFKSYEEAREALVKSLIEIYKEDESNNIKPQI